jgi:hypothetical protein
MHAYDYVRGLGNHESPEDIPFGRTRHITTKSIECEWDCGAFGPRPGVMFNNAQWIWPMTGQYCWFSGRWIYDCGHASSEDKRVGLMRSEIHPVKALATAQWEAVKFPENGGFHVPGIRFLFFASKLGGYKPFEKINDTDYEFIVDLPIIKGATSPWVLGHTPDFPFNTGVLRSPHLLHSIQFLNSGDGVPGNVQPVWETLPPEQPGELPRQVKVKIPLTQLPDNAAYYGVIINFGWLDIDRSQAKRVKRCRIRFDRLHKGDVDHDTFGEEWLFKFGVNGRWFWRSFPDVHNDENYRLNVDVPEFYLADTDSIYISSHGAELDQMDDVFHRPLRDRTLRLYGRDMLWDTDIVNGTANTETNAANRRRLWDMVYEAADMLPGGDALLNFIGIEDSRANNPLGIIDPLLKDDPERRPDNPLEVKTLTLDALPFRQTAYYVREVGESAELVEQRREVRRDGELVVLVDYTLHYEVTVQPQLV